MIRDTDGYIKDGFSEKPRAAYTYNGKRYNESRMLQEATTRHQEFYKELYELNRSLEDETLQTVRIMTQNMHSRPEPFEMSYAAIKALDLCDPALNFENRQSSRVINVAKRIGEMDPQIQPHVICFQELQGNKGELMRENMQSIGYYYDPICYNWDAATKKISGTPDTCLNSKAYTYGILPGGLFTYTTLPIVFQTHCIFPVGTGGEAFVNKGAIYTKILISGESPKKKYIHIFNCHPLAPITFIRGECEPGYVADAKNCSIHQLRQVQRDQLNLIYQFKKSIQAADHIKPSELVVYAGDMNINRYMALWETDQQKDVKKASVCCGEEFYSLLHKLKAEQPPIYLNPIPEGQGGHNGIFTWDGSENNITKSLLWPESYTWIDYVLYSIENHKPLYADNFIVRFKEVVPLYEHSATYQSECFFDREAKIEKLEKKKPREIAQFKQWDDEMKRKNYYLRTKFEGITHPEYLKLERMKKFHFEVYGPKFIKAVQQNADSFYRPTEGAEPRQLTYEKMPVDDNLRKKQKPVDSYSYTHNPLYDASDHYAVVATFVIPSQKNVRAFVDVMKRRINTDVTHELFFNLPLQPVLLGKSEDGQMLRLASRMDPRSPKMDPELWERQTGKVREYITDKRVERAVTLSKYNFTAAKNDKIFAKDEPRLNNSYEFEDCDDTNQECQRNYPQYFTTIKQVQPILELQNLKEMGIRDIDPSLDDDFELRPRQAPRPQPKTPSYSRGSTSPALWGFKIAKVEKGSIRAPRLQAVSELPYGGSLGLFRSDSVKSEPGEDPEDDEFFTPSQGFEFTPTVKYPKRIFTPQGLTPEGLTPQRRSTPRKSRS